MIKLVLFDLDGVITDSKFYVCHQTGHTHRTYNCKDAYGIKLLRDAGLPTGIVTANKKSDVESMIHINKRIDYFLTGTYDKLPEVESLLKRLGLEWSDIAYIGDDTPDIPVLEKVSFSFCPSDAINDVKNVAKYHCKNKGGDGAVREMCEWILENNVDQITC